MERQMWFWLAVAVVVSLAGVLPAGATSSIVKVTKDDGLDWRGWHSADGAWIYKGMDNGAYFYADVLSQIMAPGKTTVVNSASFNYRIVNTYEHTDPYTMQAFRITEDWSEDAPSTYAGPAYAEGYGSYTGSQVSGWLETGIDVKDLVQAWANGTYTNYGLVLRNGPTGYVAQAIYSKEVGYDWSPYFSVDYTQVDVPEPATLSFLALAGLGLLRRRK